MLPPEIPIFPLPSVVLFPHVCLPLHIFEPRYRDMVADVLKEDRLIGMVLLKPGWQADYEGRPPVYETGCAGLVSHAERLSDGRYDIVLHGLEKFRIREEVHERPYRIARIEGIAEGLPGSAGTLGSLRQRIETLVAPFVEGARSDLHIPPAISDHELVNALAQYLPLEPVERQALLERDGVMARSRSLIELLEMKLILQKTCATRSYSPQ
jgi:Lon protease-like protein